MKKLILFVAILFCCSTGYAQNAEVKITPDDVFCEKGFVVRKGSFKLGKEKLKFKGIYSPDGTVCVKCWPHAVNTDILVVAPGTKTIAQNACVTTMTKYCYIPNTVTQIGTGSFPTDCEVEIYDVNAIEELDNQ